MPGYADTRRSASLRRLDAFCHGKTLQLPTQQRVHGRRSCQGDGSAGTGAAPAAATPAAGGDRRRAGGDDRRSGGDGPRPGATTPTAAARPRARIRAALLDYLLGERRLMRRGSASIAANPVLIGAATTLVVIVAVFLAYNANNGPAVRPDLRAQGARCPARPTSSRATTCASAARASARSTDDHPGHGRRTARSPPCSTLKLETTVKPLPVDSTRARPPALGARPEVRRDHARARRARASRTARRSRSRNATPQPVEFDEVLNMFDDKTRAASQSNLTEFGNAFAGRGEPTSTARSRRSTRCCATSCRSCANLSDPRTRLARFVRALGRDRGDRRAGRPRRRRRCSATSTRRSRALANVARPFIQDSITRRAAGARRRRSRTSRSSGRSWPTARPSSTSCGPASQALRDGGAGPGRRARDRHADAASARSRSTSSLVPALRGAASASPTTRSSPLGVKRPQRAR